MPALKIDKKFVLGYVTVPSNTSNVLVGQIDMSLLCDGSALFVIQPLIVGFRIGPGSTPYPNVQERLVTMARVGLGYSTPIVHGSSTSVLDLGPDTAQTVGLADDLNYTFATSSPNFQIFASSGITNDAGSTQVIAYVRVVVNDL